MVHINKINNLRWYTLYVYTAHRAPNLVHIGHEPRKKAKKPLTFKHLMCTTFENH
jgi:hypothetical protein